MKARERNAGWRIDYFIISDRLADKLQDAEILNDIYGSDINEQMKHAAAHALASLVTEKELAEGIIIPKATDRNAAAVVAAAVADAARESGVARA